MAFTDLTKYRASLRQSKWDGWGSWCAKCGEGLAGRKADATQRTPSDNWGVDNCVVLCAECFEKIGKRKVELSNAEIPYYNRYPDMWHGNTTYVTQVGQTSSGAEF
jgi:hypothetical protein